METTQVLTLEQEQDELDKFMSKYQTEAKSLDVVEPQKAPEQSVSLSVDTTPAQPSPIPQPVNSSDPSAPFGRYQRGKKKGEPRLTPYISSKGVSSVPVQNTQVAIPPKPVQLSGMLISAGLFLMLVNLCLPLFISVVNNFFSKEKLNPEHLKLTKDQIKELDPVCDAVMKQASVTGNPVVLLILGICTAMGMNYMMWKMKQPQIKKEDVK